jgi:hypothetical protein
LTSPDDFVTWFVDAPTVGDYAVQVAYGCGTGNGGSEVEFGLGAVNDGASGPAPLTLHVRDTGDWSQFRTESIGKLRLSAGRQTLWVKARSKPTKR